MSSRLAVLPVPRSAPARAGVVVAVSLALVATLLSAPPPRAAAQTVAPNGGFALHGGLGGSVDERTGQFSATVPLTTVRGDGSAGVQIALSWQQTRATAGVDRSGWGAGWSLGSSFVDVTGVKRVYPASGGSYFIDAAEPSGLKNYKLHDLSFATRSGILPRRTGAAQVNFSYVVSYHDGRTDYFDRNGNLAARTDRFENRTDMTWTPRANNVWRPDSIVDSYGLKTTFDYSTAGRVGVVSPARSDDVVATTVIAVNTSQGVQTVTDPVGHQTAFSYASVSGAPKPLLTRITAPTGARTAISYQAPGYQPGLTAVDTLLVTDSAGHALSPEQTFDLNPSGNNRHNFTGFPNHLGTGGEDALFDSGDTAYTYTTSLRTGPTATLSTYDALHRLVRRSIAVTPAVGQLPITAQTHAMTYPTEVVRPGALPANFGKPVQVAVTQSAATSAQGLISSTARTTTTQTSYDDHGRVVSATDEAGTTTTTAYDDRFGLVTRQTTTGDDGAQAEMVNVLTDDGRNIDTSTTSVGEEGEDLSARQVLSYDYDNDGRATQRTLAWAPGAEPDGGTGGGPDEIVTTFERSVDADKGTQTITTTTGAGTDAAKENTAEIDLVSGQAITHTDALGRATTLAYDAAGRRTRITTPGGLVTSTAYTPTQTTETGPDGRVTRTTTDLLGRTISLTDNVRNGALVADPGARTLATSVFSPDGSSVAATDQAGRTATTLVDALGRQVSKVGPTGLTHLTAYDDGAAHTVVASVLPEGDNDPHQSTTSTFDDLGRTVQSQSVYPGDTGTPGGPTSDPVKAAAFDGLGQPTSSTESDLEVTTDRSGPGGIAASSLATPVSDDFPGDPVTAVTARSLSGAAMSRTLQRGTDVSTAMAVTYDAAGNVSAATDPEGRTTSYTYTADGQPETKTDPSGAETTHIYDSTSGLLSGLTVTAPGQPTRTISYTRVPPGQPGAGQVKTVSDGTDTLTYGYDADGHRTSVAYPDDTSTSTTYNDQGQLATSTDVTGAITTYVYDPGDETLTSATQRRGATVLASVSYTYDAMGRIHASTRGNGIVTTNTYTANNMLALQSTTDAAGKVLEAHSYTYDAHKNPRTRTDTYSPGGSASVPGGVATWTTVYSYDAYDQLVGSDVYSGGLTSGPPSVLATTSTRYTIDLGGDVTSTRTVRRLPGPRPITTTTTTSNTIDDSGRLTTQQTGSATRTQGFDADGRVVSSLAGVTTTYGTDGAPTSRTLADGVTKISYTSWPDGTRRTATTTDTDGDRSMITFHYGPDGVAVNDSTSDNSTGAGAAATASYLLTGGREARTLLPGTAPSGKVTGTPAAPVATGAGTGYYLRDRHTSVTGLVDASGAVTGSYAYTDYGAPARADGRPTNLGGADGGRINPYTYLGASPRGPWSEARTGLIVFAERSYDPGQGRFTSPDPVDSHNRYQGFNTNPIVYVDLSGRISTVDIVLDCVFAFVFLATAVLTAGAAAAAFGAIVAAAEVGVSVATGAVVNLVAASVATAANLTGMATSALLASDDLRQTFAADHKGWMSPNQRATVTLVNTIASATAGATGAVEGFTAGAVSAVKASTATAKAAKSAAQAAADASLVANLDQDFVQVARDAQVGEQLQVNVGDRVELPAENPGQNLGQGNVADNQANPIRQPQNQLEVNNQDLVQPNVNDPWNGGPPPPQDDPPPPPHLQQQPVNAVQNPVLAEALPGAQRLNNADMNLVLNNPEVPVALEVTQTTERLVEQPHIGDPQPVPRSDHVTRAETVPNVPANEPGTGQSASAFTNTNVHILVN